MERIRTFLVAGARPNFTKIAPIWKAMRNSLRDFEPIIIHTGQHFDYEMSDIFFRDLGLKNPDVYLGVGSGSHAKQTAKILVEFELLLEKDTPDVVVVVGDVNSTLACALATVKFRCARRSADRPLVAHVEAGLRSNDPLMPEEINRRLTDQISDILFTTSEDADENLIREGLSREKVFLVGNVMIDSLYEFREQASASRILARLNLRTESVNLDYAVLTLHRPENVDEIDRLGFIMDIIQEIAQDVTIVFPVHPRTKNQLAKLRIGINRHAMNNPQLVLIDPVGYLDFLKLIMDARFVLTDSGGIQEETTVLAVPCLTLRKNTERPITIREGTNVLCGTDKKLIMNEIENILNGRFKKGRIPKYWDGNASSRIVDVIRATKTAVIH